MITDTFWWPLDLSPPEDAAVRAFHARMETGQYRLNLHLLSRSADLLTGLMSRHVGDILDRDGLPHLCHLINGWGDGFYLGRRFTDRIASFVHRGPDGKPYVLQRDPEGEFHPWQSFAYAVMAGVDPDAALADEGPTLRELARTSRSLNTPDGHELGHLLFALAHLDPDSGGLPFYMVDSVVSVEQLVERAIQAHHFGSFEVCRKFHLTEGIAAIAALIPNLERYRETAQGFLNGQLDILFVLGAMLDQVRGHLTTSERLQSTGLLASLRNSLIVGNYFENHVYYAGHLIELAGFAAIQGYQVTPTHRAAMAFVVNEINATLPGIAPQLSFPDCFLHFGHYRRAMTLLAELDAVAWQRASVGREELQRYTVDLDSCPECGVSTDRDDGRDVLALGLYELERSANNPRPIFLEVVGCYARIARPELSPRGKFDHFRRIGPARWPRAFHYELLDYGDKVGVEIHLESDAVFSLAPLVQRLVPEVSIRLHPVAIEWDPAWWKGRGRLRALYPDDVPPSEVAHGMELLIGATFDVLDPAATALSVPALQSFGPQVISPNAFINGYI